MKMDLVFFIFFWFGWFNVVVQQVTTLNYQKINNKRMMCVGSMERVV